MKFQTYYDLIHSYPIYHIIFRYMYIPILSYYPIWENINTNVGNYVDKYIDIYKYLDN